MKKRKMIILILSVAMMISISQTGVYGTTAATPNTMRVGVTVEMDSLSPLISYSQIGYEVFSLIYDPLITIDENLEPAPNLAKEWTVSSDQTEWTFKLRDDVKWHDGEKFTSKDVKFTYDLLLANPLGMYASYLGGITEITYPDDYTVIVKTEKPKANMLLNSCPILPEQIWKDVASTEYETWANETPVGTGPFKFVEFKAGEYLKLAANDEYFAGRPGIDELVYVLYANTDTMAQSLKLREIDAATNFNTSQLETLKSEEGIDAVSAVVLGFTELSFNAWKDPLSKANPLLKDKNIRHAIEYCIDKQKILDIVYSGQGSVGTTLVPPEGFYHYEPAADELRSYSIEKAKKVLDDAGYIDTNGDGVREDNKGNKLEFVFTLRAENADEVKAGQMIAGSVAEAGIKLNIETVDDGVLIDKIYSGEFDMFIWGWGADLDPTTILNVLTTEQIGNMSDANYSNEEYDKLFMEQQTIMDPKERQAVVWKMQQILYDESPYIILFYDNSLQAVNTEKWTGWKRIPAEGGYFFNLTNYNYLNVQPYTEKATGETASNNALYMIGAIVILAVFVIYGRMRKKKSS